MGNERRTGGGEKMGKRMEERELRERRGGERRVKGKYIQFPNVFNSTLTTASGGLRATLQKYFSGSASRRQCLQWPPVKQ